MLESIRKRSGSIVVKILLFMLALSFGAWGISGYIHGGTSDTSVATVGDRKISLQDFQYEYRREYARMNQMFGGKLTSDLARQIGLPMTVAHRVISRTVLDEASNQAGFRPSDEIVLKKLRSMSQFKGPTGEFDRQAFNEAISRAGYSEAGFIEVLRDQLAREALVDGLVSEPVVPADLAKRLYAYEMEKRDILVAEVPEDAIPAGQDPSDAAVSAYFDQHKAEYRAPAYRSVSYLVIGPDAVQNEIQISEDDVKKAYDERADQFTTKAQRNVSQIVFNDEAKANKARAMLDSGSSLADVATKLTDLKKSDLDLGWIEPDSALLLPEIQKATFAASAGDIVGPVKSALGWVILKINGAKDGGVKPLAEVRDQLVKTLKHERALDLVYKLANKADEMLGSGSTLEEVSIQIAVPLKKIPAIDPRGLDKDGKPVVTPDQNTFAKTVFDQNIGTPTTLIEIKDGYYVARVDDEIPARNKTLKEVKPDVIAAIIHDQREKDAQKIAGDLAASATSKEAFDAAVKSLGGSVIIWKGVTRNGDGIKNASIYQGVLSAAFDSRVSHAVVAPVAGKFAVAMVTKVTKPDSTADKDGFDKLSKSTDQNVQTDYSDLLVSGLADHIGTTINTDAIDSGAF